MNKTVRLYRRWGNSLKSLYSKYFVSFISQKVVGHLEMSSKSETSRVFTVKNSRSIRIDFYFETKRSMDRRKERTVFCRDYLNGMWVVMCPALAITWIHDRWPAVVESPLIAYISGYVVWITSWRLDWEFVRNLRFPVEWDSPMQGHLVLLKHLSSEDHGLRNTCRIHSHYLQSSFYSAYGLEKRSLHSLFNPRLFNLCRLVDQLSYVK